MGQVRRHAERRGLVLLMLVGLAWPMAGAVAQDFDPDSVAPEDQARMQQMLESERSHVPRSLPVSEHVFTIVRTETQPRICRYFVVQEPGGSQRQGVGCRVGAGQWQLAATVGAIARRPAAPPPPTASAGAVPRVVTVIRPTTADSEAPPPTAAASPATWPNLPIPGRRPTPVVLAVPSDEADETGREVVIVAMPASLTAVPLPGTRPGLPDGVPDADPVQAAVGDRLIDVEGTAGSPPPAITDGVAAAIEEETEANREEPAEVAQGDADPAADPAAARIAGGVIEATVETDVQTAPFQPPVPAQRP